jgi:hypothetical protein
VAIITFTWVDLEGRPAGTAAGHHFLATIDGEVFAFAVNEAGVTHIDSGRNAAKLDPLDTGTVADGMAALDKVCGTFGEPRVRSVLAGARKL